MFLIQLCCFADLVLVSGERQYVFFYGFVQIFLFTALVLVSMIYENINRLLLNNMCMLLGIGLCMLSRLNFDRAVKQYIIVLASLTVSLAIPYFFTRIRFLKKIV